MITEHDVKTVEKIKAILEPMTMTRDGETGVHWEYVHMQETLDRLVNNLRIPDVSVRNCASCGNFFAIGQKCNASPLGSRTILNPKTNGCDAWHKNRHYAR